MFLSVVAWWFAIATTGCKSVALLHFSPILLKLKPSNRAIVHGLIHWLNKITIDPEPVSFTAYFSASHLSLFFLFFLSFNHNHWGHDYCALLYDYIGDLWSIVWHYVSAQLYAVYKMCHNQSFVWILNNNGPKVYVLHCCQLKPITDS